MRYLVVIEQGPKSFGAYVPDLPGCIAVGESKQEVLQQIQEAIEFHLEDIKEEGVSVPQPHYSSEFVEVQPNKSMQTQRTAKKTSPMMLM